jgi:hypothetical protein
MRRSGSAQSRKDQPTPLDVAVVREPNKAILKVVAREGKLIVEEVGGAVGAAQMAAPRRAV